MTKLSEHFTLGEMCKTKVNLENVPNEAQVKGSNHLTGCAADIRVAGIEQLVRYAAILLAISDESQEDFDELLLERSTKGIYWLHFAVRPSGNRRKVRLIQT